MAAWVDILSLTLTTFVFVGSILGAIYLVRKISAYVTRTRESLKQKGWTISKKGVSVKTSGRMNREDYLDATQRGLIKAMGASHHGVDHTINAGNSPNTSPATTYKAPAAPVRRASASSVHTLGSDSGSGNGNGNGEKSHRGLFSRKAPVSAAIAEMGSGRRRWLCSKLGGLASPKDLNTSAEISDYRVPVQAAPNLTSEPPSNRRETSHVAAFFAYIVIYALHFRPGVFLLSSHHYPLRDLCRTGPMIAHHPERQRSSTGDDTPVRQPTPKQTPIVRQPSTRFTAIWDAAIKSYQDITKIDIAKVSPGAAGNGGLTADGLWETIDDEQSKFAEYRSRGANMRRILMPVFNSVEAISQLIAGKTSWKPCETVFTAVKLLFDAVGNVGPRYETIMEVFNMIFSRLDKCRRAIIHGSSNTVTLSLRKRLADVLAQVLLIIGMLTNQRQKQKGKFAHFFLSRFSKRVNPSPVTNALERFIYLT
ncbi:hypothetical protein EVG20_g9724 [Dentipellis fragilis]|uniref:Fungal STAND N-terminal Goodbye domain-containing protein n=1 Tax=Dentipellis fragilis TaxID=205917 RepID=A0A4Y9XW74_9AGAM|nr:hypothetical protein EVG20_g9724 [Dentipellis fragilis]